MKPSGFDGIKVIAVLAMTAGYAFLFVDQRLSSKEMEAEIARTKARISQVESEKRKLSREIQRESARMSCFDYQRIGKPIAAYDVVSIRIPESKVAEASPSAESRRGPVDRLIAFFSGFGAVN